MAGEVPSSDSSNQLVTGEFCLQENSVHDDLGLLVKGAVRVLQYVPFTYRICDVPCSEWLLT